MWSIIGYCLLGLLGLAVAALLLPTVIRLDYREVLTVRVWVLGIPVYRFSSKSTKSFTKPRTVKADKPAKTTPNSWLSELTEKLKTDGVHAVVDEVRWLSHWASGTARQICSAVTLDRLLLQLVVASRDAATTAQDTGRVCAVLYPALTTLQYVVRIRKRAVTVTPDYLATKGRVTVRVVAHACAARLLWVVLHAASSYDARRSHTVKKAEEAQEYGA